MVKVGIEVDPTAELTQGRLERKTGKVELCQIGLQICFDFKTESSEEAVSELMYFFIITMFFLYFRLFMFHSKKNQDTFKASERVF